MKQVKNDYWNGKDAAFLRCINSETGQYHDVLISHGQGLDSFEEICKKSFLLNSDFGIITGNFFSTDIYIAFHTESGEIKTWKKNEAYGNIVGSGYKGFWMDIDNFSILYPCDMLYEREPEIIYEDGIQNFISDYNEKINKLW